MKERICIRELKKKDYDKARKFAIKGMNLERYTENSIEMFFYSKYFLYLELLRTTQVLAAYIEDELVGILFAEFKNEPKVFHSIWASIYVNTVKFILNVMYKGSNDLYDEVNSRMLDEFNKKHVPDGELIFFVTNPEINGRGIGSVLLEELQQRESGKLIYLYTDNGCSYQFYDKRGFIREAEEKITMNIHGKDVPINCFLYSKRL